MFRVLAFLLLLPIFIILLLQVYFVQNFLKDTAARYLTNKLGTRVVVDGFDMDLFSRFSLTGVTVEDRQRDTLFHSGELEVHYDLLQLLRHRIVIHSLRWTDVSASLSRMNGDSSFNYQFILNAFSSDAEEDTLYTEGQPMRLTLDSLQLTDFRLLYLDEPGGVDVRVTFDTIGVRSDHLDLDSLRFVFQDLFVDGLHGSIRRHPSRLPAETATVTTGPLPVLAAERLSISRSDVNFADETAGFGIRDTIQAFSLRRMSIDLQSQKISVDTLLLDGIRSAVRLRSSLQDVQPETTETSLDTTGFVIHTGLLSVRRSRFQLDNVDSPYSPYPASLDYNHLLVDSLDGNIQTIRYDRGTIAAVVDRFAMHERSGFTVKRFQAKVHYDSASVALDDLLLETGGSFLSDTLRLNCHSWASIGDSLNNLRLYGHFDGCVFDGKELAYFMPGREKDPSWQPIFRKLIRLNAHVYGSLANLHIPEIRASDQDGNTVRFHGNIQDAGDPSRILADLDIAELRSGSRQLRSWLAPGTLPSDIRIPKTVLIRGPLTAGPEIIDARLDIRTSDGNIRLRADSRDYLDSIRARYLITFATSGIPLGQWMGDTSLGRLVAQGMLRGEGWVPERMKDTLSLDIPLMEYRRYPYQDVQIRGALDRATFQALILARDTSLRLQADLAGSIDSLRSYLKGNIRLDKFDLYSTHWSDTPFTVMGGLGIRLEDIRPYHLKGAVNLDSLRLATDGQILAVDTVRMLATDSSGVQQITLQGPFGEIKANGHFNYQSIAGTVGNILTYHLQAPDTVAGKDNVPEDEDIQVVGRLIWPTSLQHFLPALSLPHPITFSLRARSDSLLVSAVLNAPTIRFNDFALDSIKGIFHSDRDSLRATLNLGRMEHPNFPLAATQLNFGGVRGNLHTELVLGDDQGRPKYAVGTDIAMLPDSIFRFHMHPDVLLDKQEWSANLENDVMISHGLLQKANLEIRRGPERLAVMTREDDTTGVPALKINLDGLSLATLTKILASDTALAEGTAHGSVELSHWTGSPEIHANIGIDSLRLMHTAVGNLRLEASGQSSDAYKLNLAVQGDRNDILLQGTYTPSKEESLDFGLTLQPLFLPGLTPLVGDMARQLAGRLKGKLQVQGSPERPRVLGDLTFSEAAFLAVPVNAYFHLYNEKISFRADGIHFDHFVLADSADNEAVLTGSILTRNYRQFRFNLDLNAQNFKILGGKQEGDQLFYGPAFIDSRITLRGSPDFPKINMNLTLKEKSQVTFAIPESEPGIENREGVVEFIDRNHPLDSSWLHNADTIRVRSHLKGIEFSGNLEVNPDASLKIVIDRQNGDNLLVKGGATLNTTMDPGGNLLITGEYKIQQGQYQMSLNQLIKRSFDIQKGSTITWTGRPTDAQVDITAMYEAQASAIDLIADQLSNATPEMRIRYKQKLPIQVYLLIKGDMMKPEISFRLDMPEDHQNDLGGTIYTRLKQINQIPSELNKQVMGLLVLNSFIPDNPMDVVGNGGGGLEQVAAQSVSKILSQQLNNLAANLIQGVDLNFDLESQQDYSSGAAEKSTTLNVGVSKHLFNDRLTVSVGNDFALEGNSREASGIAGNVSVDYALTRDGRYRLRAYRKNTNEEIIQGQVVETGLTFSLVMDFNKFREIFEKVKKEERRRLRKQKK